MITMISGALVSMSITLLLCLNRVLKFADGFGQDDYSILVAFLAFPAVCILVYAICQSVLIVRTLGLFTPLLYVGFAALCVSVYSIVTFALNESIVESSGNQIDGVAVGNLFMVVAGGLVFGYWTSITQSDSDKKY